MDIAETECELAQHRFPWCQWQTSAFHNSTEFPSEVKGFNTIT